LEFVQPIRNKEQINAVKAILKASSSRNYCLFVLGINSGLRISDLLKLKLQDVCDGKGQIRDRITVREQKTGKNKDFPVGETTQKALKEYINTDTPPDTPLFQSQKGGALTRQQVYRILNDAAKKAGIKDKIGTHTMRKTFGYHTYQAGVDVAYIQKLLNHSSPAVTLRYLGITQDDLDNIYLTLNL
jgi:site-specific recombinase XerD